MQILVKVKTKASQQRIKRLADNYYTVWVTELPVKGRANEAVKEVLAGYFHISKSNIKILSGKTSQFKRIEIGN